MIRIEMNSNFYDIIIVGSGPAGLTAAKIAAENAKSVLVLERNEECAKKIYATGGGRCNFMNKKMDGAADLLAYCNGIGIIETEEEEGRLYPRSLQASSVANILNFAAKKAGAEIVTGALVSDISKKGEAFEVAVQINGQAFAVQSKQLLIATGGKAGIQYGCYGDGYKWAQSFGHRIVKPIPALTGLECAEDISLLHGVRIRAKAALLCSAADKGNAADRGVLLAEDAGEVQFTRDGISGICVMNLSRYLRFEEGKYFTLCLDLYPEYMPEELLELFMRQKQLAGCAMEGLVPEKMHDYLHTRIKPSEHGPAGMAALSKALNFTVTGSKGWKQAQVTCGGVALDEVTENYGSKLVPGLFFAGEVLDYDGPCGGYNIGFAIKSGKLAGEAMSR